MPEEACTWIDGEQVLAWLGITPSQEDENFVSLCASAANQFAFRRRREAGYADDPGASPGDDVTLGTTIYAGTLYRERSAGEGFASYEMMTAGVSAGGGLGQVYRLLGLNRPRVA